MASKPLPPVLYKYYPPARIESIEYGTIRFTSPAEFNDTFDSDYLLKSPTTPEARAARLTYRKNLGIFCMTEDPDNHLMWVHYAAQHTGFVVGLDTAQPVFSAEGATVEDVEYDKKPVIISDPANLSIRITLVKSTDWSYEQEWRCVRTFGRDKSRDVYLGVEGITEIILGSKMATHDISRLLAYAELSKTLGGHEVTVSESVPVRKSRRFEHRPSSRALCTKCEGIGHLIDETKRPVDR